VNGEGTGNRARGTDAVTLVRETRETQIRVTLGTGRGEATADTGLPFLDHMLVTFARYAGLDLAVHARGDLPHHTIEDVAIVVGAAVARVLPATAARYGDRTIPMDDALVHAAVDLGGRPFYRGPLPHRLYDHWMRSFADNARATVHLRVLRGTDRHHVVEAAFKALALAVRDAFVETGAVFSTKGAVALREEAQEPGAGNQGDR
jgi:imidazoleglycerol-phosphate dehydratase